MEMVILGFHSQSLNVKMMQEKHFGLFLVVFCVFFRFWLDVNIRKMLSLFTHFECSSCIMELHSRIGKAKSPVPFLFPRDWGSQTTIPISQAPGKPNHHSHFPRIGKAKPTLRAFLAAPVSPRWETSGLGDVWAAQNCIYVLHSSEDMPKIPTHSQDHESSPDNFSWVGSHWKGAVWGLRCCWVLLPLLDGPKE